MRYLVGLVYRQVRDNTFTLPVRGFSVSSMSPDGAVWSLGAVSFLTLTSGEAGGNEDYLKFNVKNAFLAHQLY